MAGLSGSQQTTTSSSRMNKSSPCPPNPTVKRYPRISRWALQEIAEVCDDQISTCQEVQALTPLSRDNVEIQGLLGEGGFCSVYSVKIPNGGETTYALKQLRRHKRGRDEEDWVLAVYDICNETCILAKLAPHPNIVKMIGVCESSVSTAYKQHPEGFFFVMESLPETLSDRLNGWRNELKHNTGRLSRLRRRHSMTSSAVSKVNSTSDGGVHLLSSASVYERLQSVAIGVAHAMSHLHSNEHQIALRDLKPPNIGFDANGVVKLFDFGMARVVHETDTAELAGTFRFISPEAIMGHRIGLESDVYSFGVILYELVTLLKPFDQYFQRGKLVRKEAFYEHVVVGGWRPSLSGIPCRATRRLIAKCWDPAPRARPCFDRIYFLLNQIVNNNRDNHGACETSSPEPVTAQHKAPVSSSHLQTQRPVPIDDEGDCSVSPLPSKSGSTFRGLFRGLKPLSKLSKRGCSDLSTETATSSVTGE